MRNDSLSLAEARRIALAAQGFAAPRPTGRIDRRHLRRVMDRLQLLQLDSVPVVIRTQYLPIFSRLGAYPPELLDALAYPPRSPRRGPPRSPRCGPPRSPRRGAREAEWFEAWSHEASLLPVGMEPWLRWAKQRAREGATWGWLHRLATEEPGYVEAVRQEVAERGPLAAGELSDPRPRRGAWWGSRSVGAMALDWLFRVGELGVRRRPGFVKEFDLLERVVPEAVLAEPTPTFEEALDELLVRAAWAHGIGSADCLVDYFRLPVRPAKARLAALVEEGRLVACAIDGWTGPAYRHPEARCPRRIEARALLSPFDPVVWHRRRSERLFDFEYRLEIYTPAPKRRWGYYVLPFLMGDRLVARFDLKTDRAEGVLRVHGAHLEPGVSPGEVARAAAQELGELARLVGARRVQVGRRGGLARPLARAVAAAERTGDGAAG